MRWPKNKGAVAATLLLAIAGLAADAFWIELDRFIVRPETLAVPHWSTPVRIAALSDLHIGSSFVGLDKLREIVDRTNAEHPDVVVITGDFVIGGPRADGPSRKGFVPPEPIAAELKNLHPPLGLYIVLGNHDWWFDGHRITAAFQKEGLTVLENEAVRVPHPTQPFWIGGIADLWTRSPDIPGTLAQTNPAEPVVLFTHNPDIFPEVPDRVSLLIAGHTHGGQVEFPFFGTPVTVSKYRKGHIVENGRHLYVTTGVGTSIAPVRFLVTPEMALLTLTPQP